MSRCRFSSERRVLDYADRNAPPALDSTAPPAHALVMPAVAAAAGVSVETVLSGAGEEFSRPEQAIRPRGPITNALDGRLTGMSRSVDAIATELARAVDAPLDGRVGNPR